MKIKVVREQFQKALHRVNSIVGSRTMLPILGNVLLNAENDKVTLMRLKMDLQNHNRPENSVKRVMGRRLCQLTPVQILIDASPPLSS